MNTTIMNTTKKYTEETGKKPSSTTATGMVFNDEYVFWLEEQLELAHATNAKLINEIYQVCQDAIVQ